MECVVAWGLRSPEKYFGSWGGLRFLPTLSLVMVGFALPSFARADKDLLKSQNLPERANLSFYFKKINDVQQGSFCHLYAATGLAEGACNKLFWGTGRTVDLSDFYLSYRHLEDRMCSESTYEYVEKTEDSFTSIDGGWTYRDLVRIFTNKTALVETEMPWQPLEAKRLITLMQPFSKKAKILQGQIDAKKISPEIESKLRNALGQRPAEVLKSELDRWFLSLKMAGATKSAWCGYEVPTRDRNLKECLEHDFRINRYSFTLRKAVQLLGGGDPFVCSGWVKFTTSENEPSGRHATVIIGYRRNPSFPEGIEFLARDPNFKHPTWGWNLINQKILADQKKPKEKTKERGLYCQQIIYLCDPHAGNCLREE